MRVRMPALIAVAWLTSLAVACGDAFERGPDSSGAGTSGATSGTTSRAGSDAGGRGGTGDTPEGGSGESIAGESGTNPQAGTSSGGTEAGGAGGSSGNGTAGVTASGGGGDGPTEPQACQSTAECSPTFNCIDELCVPALATCAAQKNKYPASPDGLYWIGKGDDAIRTYCDMDQAIALCSEVEGEHQGRTRDSSKLAYVMSSVLLLETGVCKMWAIRAVADGYPIGGFEAVAGVPAGQTCSKLGFIGDGKLGACNFGSMRSNCGYELPALNRYGNNCSSGCQLSPGQFDHWRLQGPMNVASTLSTKSGSTFTTCKTQ